MRPCRSAFQLSAFRFQPSSSAFTLVELLVVIVIIGILFGFITSAVMRSRIAARRRQAESDCYTLAAAAQAYYHQFGEWPVSNPHGGQAVRILTEDNREVMMLLLDNPLKKSFLNEGEYRFDSNTNVLTPWGVEYTFIINRSDRADSRDDHRIGPDTARVIYEGDAH